MPLVYFEIEPGFEATAILTEYYSMQDLSALVDVRENSAYLAFVAMIGGYVNFEENGYDILTKEYKRELKYAAGNLMKLQMRSIVDKAAQTLLNFFSGFPTFKQIMRTEKPMRHFRTFLTKEWVSTKRRIEEERKKRAEEEEKKQQPMSKYEEVAMKKKASNQIKSNEQKKYHNYWDAKAELRIPDFYDFQDLVNPVIRLDLTLVSSSRVLNLT